MKTTKIVEKLKRFFAASKNNSSKRETDPFKIASRITGRNPVVIDGGACRGGTIEKIKKVFDEPFIYAVEPLPIHTKKLKEKYGDDDKVKVMPVAIGPSEESIHIRKTNKTNSSSVYKPSNTLLEYRKENKNNRKEDYITSNKVRVEQKKIDNLTEKSPSIIKLDLQGYELNALKGAREKLKECRVVITEVEFIEHYKDQPLFRHVDEFLSENNFRFFSFSKLRVEKDDCISTTDAIYLNKKFDPKSIQ